MSVADNDKLSEVFVAVPVVSVLLNVSPLAVDERDIAKLLDPESTVTTVEKPSTSVYVEFCVTVAVDLPEYG